MYLENLAKCTFSELSNYSELLRGILTVNLDWLSELVFDFVQRPKAFLLMHRFDYKHANCNIRVNIDEIPPEALQH